MDRKKVITWLADNELYYRDHGDTHNSLMACNVLALLKERNDCENCAIAIEDRQLVVRCRDCKYRSEEMYNFYDNPNNKVYVCQIHDLAKKPDWFCADGERREDDG